LCAPHTHLTTLSLHDALPISHLLSLTELTALFRQASLELLDAKVSERKRRLEDWLGAAVGEGGVPAQRRLQRHLRVKLLETARGDRKSTRLNSSHVAISYAVF